MSKLSNVVLVSALALSLAACDTPPTKPEPQAPIHRAAEDPDRCTYSGTDITAPAWICGTPIEGVQLSAVGIGEPTGDENFDQDMAAAAARLKLASGMKTQVQGMIKKYRETQGAGANMSVDQVNTSVTRQITNETLSGSQIIRTKVGPNGKVYVLVGLKPEAVAAYAENVVKTSMNNERAMWQKFQAGKAQDELAAAIAAQRVPPQVEGAQPTTPAH